MANKSVNIILKGTLITNPHKLDPEYNKYKIHLAFDENEAKKIDAARDKVYKEVFGNKPKKLTENLHQYGDDVEFPDTFEKFYLNTKTPHKPIGYLKTGNTLQVVSDEDFGKYFYRGAKIAVKVEIMYRAKWVSPDTGATIPEQIGKRYLGMVFMEHGERLDSVVTANDFGDVESEVDTSQDTTDITDEDINF